MTFRHSLTAVIVSFAAALALTACSSMPGMHKGDIPTDQNPAHDMHKSQGT